MSIAAEMDLQSEGQGDAGRLNALEKLAASDIETAFTTTLSRDLHSLFDPVSDDALPIYFGPLLGRLYLEGF